MSIKSVVRRIRLWVAGVIASIGAALGIYVTAQTSPVQDVLTWTMPPQNTDNSALPLSAIAKTTAVWGPQGGPYTDGTQDAVAPATTVTLIRSGNGYGTRCYKVAVTTTPAAGSIQGLWSNEACKTVRAPPGAPTNLTAQ